MAMLRAIHRAELLDLKEMIADGADLDAQSDQWSPAMQACGDGQITALRLLIETGADLDAPGENGMTPLIVAAMEEEEACLAALLKAGVDLEKRDIFGSTAAAHAASRGSPACLARLLKAGADIEACLAYPVAPSCQGALDAERARRERIALAKSAPRAKRSGKTSRI